MRVVTPGRAPLLETKLRLPRRRPEVLPRSRLTEALADSARATLTVVSAPAGFGKTTLLIDWLTEGPLPAAWLSLERLDSEPARFWSYVIAALRTVLSEVGDEAMSLLQREATATESIVASLLNDLDTAASDVALVLDDYHLIESPEVHESVAFFVDHLPPQVHLVIAARSDPPLPLGRLRARGELVEMRAGDLRFTTDETASYLREALPFELTDPDVHALDARTEGWVAALQLAALSLRSRDDPTAFIANFTGNDRFVLDYLVEEVLDRQSPALREFLLHTSVLSRLHASLCDAVTNRPGGVATLERLDRANLFVVALDDQRLWYRYHHLFGDVLRANLAAEDPALVSELHRRASRWYDDDGDWAEAVTHAIAAGDVESAAMLIELATPAARQSRQEHLLRRWLEQLPEGLLENRPVLAITLVGARMATGDSRGVEPLLRSAQRWVPGSDDHERTDGPIVFDTAEFATLPAQIAMYRAGVALLEGDLPTTIAYASQVSELTDRDDHVRLGAAAALSGLAHWATGALDRASQLYSDAIEHFAVADFIPDVLGCSLGLADIQVAQGHLHAAQATFERALHLASGTPGLRGSADMHIGLCELAIERDDLGTAVSQQWLAREHGDAAGLPQNPYRWRVATARLLHLQGARDAAHDLLDQAARLYETDFSPSVRPVPALKARLSVQDGDLDGAMTWVAARGLRLDDDGGYLLEYELLTLARIHLALHRAGEADLEPVDDLLARVSQAAEPRRRIAVMAEAAALTALAQEARGDRRAALAALDRALTLTGPEGHVRLFLDEGPPMLTLLRSKELSASAAAHAQRMLGAPRDRPPAPPRAGLIDELSERELDVLGLLRSDMNGPEIARELLVSLNTLRTHTKHIYAKLGVNNRRAALTRAGELGL